jgi:hypothetical protein
MGGDFERFEGRQQCECVIDPRRARVRSPPGHNRSGCFGQHSVVVRTDWVGCRQHDFWARRAVCVQIEDLHAAVAVAYGEVRTAPKRRIEVDCVSSAWIQQNERHHRQGRVPDSTQAVPVAAADVCGRRDEVSHDLIVFGPTDMTGLDTKRSQTAAIY